VLDGEAYIEVAHAEGAPFTVETGNATMRVLGTAFLIRTGHGESADRVAVVDGKVLLRSHAGTDPGMTVSAGYVGEVHDSLTHVIVVDDVASGVEWIHSKLVFRRASVAAVLGTLTRWYGYQFVCADPTLLDRRVTIGVSVQSSAVALMALEQVLGVNVSVVGNTITLKPQPVAPVNSAPRIRAYDVWTPTSEVGR
jgi:transmembrane sensor